MEFKRFEKLRMETGDVDRAGSLVATVQKKGAAIRWSALLVDIRDLRVAMNATWGALGQNSLMKRHRVRTVAGNRLPGAIVVYSSFFTTASVVVSVIWYVGFGIPATAQLAR